MCQHSESEARALDARDPRCPSCGYLTLTKKHQGMCCACFTEMHYESQALDRKRIEELDKRVKQLEAEKTGLREWLADDGRTPVGTMGMCIILPPGSASRVLSKMTQLEQGGGES